MAKFYGCVGYVESVETAPGVFMECATEHTYSGDVTRNSRRNEKGDSVNDDLVLNNMVSIISDPYSENHLFAIRYIRWQGALWKVTNVEVQRPRLLLTIGGVYNGPSFRP
jgi:hypothetical protein